MEVASAKAKWMNLGENVVSEVKRQQVEQIEVHGVVGELDGGDFNHPAVMQVKLGNGQMVGQSVPADRRNAGHHAHQQHQTDDADPEGRAKPLHQESRPAKSKKI